MAMEVKVYYRKRNKGKTQQIDHIPKCFQLRRSPSASKPRTDFSLPICSSKDLEMEPRSSKEIQSSVTIGCSDTSNDTIRGTTDPSNRSNKRESKGQEMLPNCIEVPVTDVKSFGQKAHFQPCSNRNRNDEERGDNAMALELTPNRSQLTESGEVRATPGSVVWAKNDGKCWWPAEILGERSSLAQSGIVRVEGHVLVQYFGKHGSVWVDPATDLSPFEDCFEERSCNQAKEFQNALKQALYYKEHPRSCKESYGSPDVTDRLNHHDQLPEKDNSSSSSRAGTDCTGRVRSKRERKRKVHFDEVSCPLYTSRKVRRFKIMRSLGLAAPVGSPFNSS